jgi:hypothetical protein
MTIGGLVFMIVSLTAVWGLASWCYLEVLTGSKPPDHDRNHDHDHDQ